ncbi:MAG: glycosyltransferase family 39 protein [Chloroflexi bacterium]|nr:glycosyltransferase family 39 protein [Chloroflexota bacterium]
MGKKKAIAENKKERRLGNNLAWLLLVAGVLVIAAIRIRLLGCPLERDEGEFAYMGQLMLHGIPPYRIAANMKLPGIYAVYALIMAVFGRSITGVHLGLLVFNLAAVVMVFILGRRLFDPLTGAVAGVSYGALSLGHGVLGLSAHATQFVTFFALWGLLLLMRALDSGRLKTYFASGILFGIAFLMKQPGLVFALFAVFYVIWRETRRRDAAWKTCLSKTGILLVGTALPFGITCLSLWLLGVFPRFWFWTFRYAMQYGGEVPFSLGLTIFWRTAAGVIQDAYPLWALALAGAVILLWFKENRSRAVFVFGLLAFSFAAVCPGMYFRPQYFVVILPAVALLVGVAVAGTARALEGNKRWVLVKAMPWAVLGAALAYPFGVQRDVFFKLNPAQVSRSIYTGNPFPEAVVLGKYLRSHTTPADTIAVLGSEPEIYFYSDRHSATDYIYTYALVEDQKFAKAMQSELINQVQSAKPKYIVWVQTSASWTPRPGFDPRIFHWAGSYLSKDYHLEGVVIPEPDPANSVYAWGREMRDYPPVDPGNYLLVYRRKPGI